MARTGLGGRSRRWQRAGGGVEMRPLVEGEGTALMLYRIAPGSKLKVHTHRFPEYGTVLSGHGVFHLPEGLHDLHPGDTYYIPTGIPHGFEVAERSEAVVMLHVAVGLAAQLRAPMFRHLLKQTRAVSSGGAQAAERPARAQIRHG